MELMYTVQKIFTIVLPNSKNQSRDNYNFAIFCYSIGKATKQKMHISDDITTIDFQYSLVPN